MAYADITTKERNKGLKQVIDFFKQENSKKKVKEVIKNRLFIKNKTKVKLKYGGRHQKPPEVSCKP